MREVPLGRLVTGDQNSQFASQFVIDAAVCIVGQVFPVRGG